MKKIFLSILMLGAVVTTYAQNTGTRQVPAEDRLYAVRVLNDADFKQLQSSINAAPFAADKKNIFRLGIQGAYITVDQLQILVKQLAFDDDKMDWLFIAYPRTADVQHFYRLRESLAFISSKEKFDTTLLNMADNDSRQYRRAKILSQEDFAQLQDQMSKEAFADGRKRVFKLGVQYRFITVAQISQLMKQMTFDDEKLAIAKMAYDRTADIQRFYTLRDNFTFDSTKQQLDRFLLQNKS